MPPRLPSLGGSPAKAMALPHIQPASPRPNVSPQGSPGIAFGSDLATAQASPGADQGNSGAGTSTDIRAGAQPFEPPFQGDVYNGPIPLKTLALSEDGAFERLAESLETLSRKNSPKSDPSLGSEDQAIPSFALQMREEILVVQNAFEADEGGSGGGNPGPVTVLGDAAKNAVHVLKRLENRRVNLGQTYMVTVKEAYECLKETEHILEEYHSQVGTQIFEQLNTFIKALDADFKTLQSFFEKQKEEQKKQDKELCQKVDQASTSALATEKAVTDAGTKIHSLLNNLKQTVEGLKNSLDEVGKQVQEKKEHQEKNAKRFDEIKELLKKVDQASTSAAAVVLANSETKISELFEKAEVSVKILETAFDSKIEAASLSAAESQTSVFKSTLDGFQTILNGLSDNIQILATQGSATAAVLTLQNRFMELQNQQQTIEEKLTRNWTEKLNKLEEHLKAQAERITELEKPPIQPTPLPNLFHNFETDVVEPNAHPALKLAVAGNCFLPHLHYHRHRIGVDWELSAGLHKGTNSLENILQNRWFVGIKVEPFVSLALQTLSSRSGVSDGRGTHTSRKLQIQNFHFIRELGETENQPYSRVEIGWDFGPIFKNGSVVIPVNLGGYWLDESVSSQNYLGNFGNTSAVGSIKALAPGLASDFTDALKSVPRFWRFFSKTDWYISSGATFDTKYWHNSLHFPIAAKVNGTIQLKAPGNKESVGLAKFVETSSKNFIFGKAFDLEKGTQATSPVLKGNMKDDSSQTLNHRLMKFETKVDDITKKIKSIEPKVGELTNNLQTLEPKVDAVTNKMKWIEPKIGTLTKKSDCIETMMLDQKGLQTKLETRLQNQETLVADHEKRFMVQKEEQAKCCQKVLKNLTDLETKSAGENDSFENQSTESPLDWLSKALVWSAAVEGCFGFIQGFGLGFLYLFLLRQQLRTTNLLEKNLYRTARFFIPAGYFAGLFVSLGMITINFVSGLPLDTKWPIIEKVAQVSESLVQKIPGHDTIVVQKINKVVFYGMSYGIPFASVTKLFQTAQTPYTTVLICIRLSVSFILFSKITSWWTTWLLSDSELDLKKEEQGQNCFPQFLKQPWDQFSRVPKNTKRFTLFPKFFNLLSVPKTKFSSPKNSFFGTGEGPEWTCFCLELFAVDPLESPRDF